MCMYITIGHQWISRYYNLHISDTVVKSSKFKCVHGMPRGHACAVQFMQLSLVTPSYILLVASFRLARQQLTLYTIPGSVWPVIAFLTSLEGSAIEMKPTAPVSEDTAVSLKA